MTKKATKRIALIPGASTWTAPEWTNAWIDQLLTMDFSLPSQIITDRDPKFLSSFWKAACVKLGIKMLTSTAYHPQTDGQSERTNQTVEVALRFLLCENPAANWPAALPSIQATMNNSRNATTGFAPNEVLTGFCSNLDSLYALTDLPPQNLADLRMQIRQEVKDSVALANVAMKERYDAKHKPISFCPGDMVFLRLHHGYSLVRTNNMSERVEYTNEQWQKFG